MHYMNQSKFLCAWKYATVTASSAHRRLGSLQSDWLWASGTQTETWVTLLLLVHLELQAFAKLCCPARHPAGATGINTYMVFFTLV